MQGAAYLKQLLQRPIPEEMAFSVAEYRHRVDRVRTQMDAAGIDLLLVTLPANLCYLAGYTTFAVGRQACLLLPREGQPKMLVASMEIPAALLSGWVRDIEVFDWNENEAAPHRLAKMVSDMGYGKKRLGVETKRASLTIDAYEKLRAGLTEARFTDVSSLVQRVRMIKSPAEIEYMRQAASLTTKGIHAALQVVKPGRTDNDVARAAFDAMVAAGSEFLNVDPIVTTGHRSGWAHTTFNRTPLKAGDAVFMEFSGCYHRYCALVMQTAYIGKPPAMVQRIADAARDTVRLIMENARPGRTAHDVSVAAHTGHVSVNHEIYFQEVYGEPIGLGFPSSSVEGPAVIAQGAELVLQEGMTFHLPIAFRVPGEYCMGLSETILITKGGCEGLTGTDRELIALPV